MVRREVAIAVVAFVSAAIVSGQQSASPTASAPSPASPLSATAYYAGPGVAPPELIPLHLEEISSGECHKLDGAATLSAIVDANGVPVQIILLRPAGNGLDAMAIHMLSLDRFKPGMRDGAPAATVISDEIKLQTCIEQRRNETGRKITTLHIRSAPDQKISLMRSPGKNATTAYIDNPSEIAKVSEPGPGITPPVVIHSVEAQFSDYARQNHISGVCLIALIVDEHGLPHDLRVARSLEPSLDQNAIEALGNYRFKPAMNKGMPIPYRITIEVEFLER